MSLLHNQRVFRFLTRWIICGVYTEERVCALTFDDGPSRRHTPRLLEQLERHGCRATFFVLGKHVRRLPRLLAQIAAAGHEIGNHSYHHPYLTLCPTWMVRKEIGRTGQLIEEITGARPQLFRPPAGWFNQRILGLIDKLDYQTVLGDVYPRDPRRPGTQRITDLVMSYLQPGSIVILHDASSWGDFDRSQTLAAVDQIVPRLQDQGFELVTVSELIERGSVLRPETIDLRGGSGRSAGGLHRTPPGPDNC